MIVADINLEPEVLVFLAFILWVDYLLLRWFLKTGS